VSRRGLILLAVLTGCAGVELRSQVAATHGLVKQAWRQGAYTCAPRELALADSHAHFADQELDEGDFYRAKQELAIAKVNADEALRKSPMGKCANVVVEKVDSDGDGIFDDVDDCPKIPEDKDGFEDENGCPDPDNDKDGILDASDKCPMDPEDKDGFEDADGCPEDDNDKDGFLDKADKCPNDAEDKDGFEDTDGCPDADNDGDKVVDWPQPTDKCPNEPAPDAPDGCPQKYQLIVVTSDRIELKQSIFFDTRKTKIKPVSFPLLDEVAKALKDNPTIRVRIEGHTDSRGSDRFNLKLSGGRAEAVRKYLIGRGIEPGRMESRGFGETAPIADNRTEQGRAQNRRVDFIITGR
jgi:OmpA-OmpF porin, OOP family